MIQPTSNATPDQIAQAYEERLEQAYKAVLAETGPLPDTEWKFRRWRRKVNRRWRRVLKRLN